MGTYSKLKIAIEDGLTGKNEGLPTGLDRLDNYISLKKKMMITIFGSTGSAKSTLVNQAFVLNPWEYCSQHDKPIKIIVFSMERSIVFTNAKQLVAKIFKDKGKLIDLPLLLGWYKDRKLNGIDESYIEEYQSYFNAMDKDIKYYEGQRTVKEIDDIILEFAEKNGKYENIDGNPVYIPDTPEEEVIIVVDHIGLTKRSGKSKKETIDELIVIQQEYRDINGYSFINVCQVNRDLSKGGKDIFEPHLDHIKETGSVADASDLVLSIFDPIRYNTKDINYGDVSKFRCPKTGHKFFRNIGILKNSYGIDGASVGTVFMGQTGIIKTLPKAKELNEEWQVHNYEEVFNYKYFR